MDSSRVPTFAQYFEKWQSLFSAYQMTTVQIRDCLQLNGKNDIISRFSKAFGKFKSLKK
jgi:hypothetical protein